MKARATPPPNDVNPCHAAVKSSSSSYSPGLRKRIPATQGSTAKLPDCFSRAERINPSKSPSRTPSTLPTSTSVR